MTIVSALDVHRSQITFKSLDLETGQVKRGRMMPACRQTVREWVGGVDDPDAHAVLEATTGWRFVAEELQRAGVGVHLADPAETSVQRGPKRRAKTDHKDCDLMCQLLVEGRLPEAWIPPPHILELRTLVRLRKQLVDERIEWQARIHAQLFHQGVPPGPKLLTHEGRARLAVAQLSPAGRHLVDVGLTITDALEEQLRPLDRCLSSYVRRQPGCRALVAQLYGVGFVTATAILAELGDCRRFSSSDQAVRYAGLDVTVHDSNAKRPPGYLSQQGPPLLRWALFEAAQAASHKASPDHAYYRQVRDRIDHNRACLSVARKLCRRAYHLLRSLGDDAIAPPADDRSASAAAFVPAPRSADDLRPAPASRSVARPVPGRPSQMERVAAPRRAPQSTISSPEATPCT